MTNIARLEQIYKRVTTPKKSIDILNGVSLTISPGESIAIMGPSGCGKSTLLNMIGLLDQPTFGIVELGSQRSIDLSEDAQAHMRRRYIGFIFQRYHLFPQLTVAENIALPMAYAGATDRLQRSLELLEQVGLADRADVFPSTLSGGERQRVAIARALANQPSLLLADEPTGALDSESGQQVMSILKRTQKQGTAVVLVTHDPMIAAQAERTLRMKDGRLAA